MFRENTILDHSILDFAQSAVRRAKPSPSQPATQDPRPSSWRSIFELSEIEISETKGWDAYAIDLEKRRKAIRHADDARISDSRATAEEERRAQDARLMTYFQQVVEELEEMGVRTWEEPDEDLPSQSETPDDGQELTENSELGSTDAVIGEAKKPFKRYSLFMEGRGEGYPGTHLIPLYDELYEACWNGDNDKIRALCLPPADDSPSPASGTRDLLQITARVKYTDHDDSYSEGEWTNNYQTRELD